MSTELSLVTKVISYPRRGDVYKEKKKEKERKREREKVSERTDSGENFFPWDFNHYYMASTRQRRNGFHVDTQTIGDAIDKTSCLRGGRLLSRKGLKVSRNGEKCGNVDHERVEL